MEILLYIVGGIVALFGFVIIFGAPYVPTLRSQIKVALDLLDLKPGQTLIEVGSGDGRVLLAAAERGWHVVGYELNPVLVLWSRWRVRKHGKKVRIIWGNALTKRWPAADAVYVFGIDRIMPKLHTKVVQSIQKPVKLASFGFKIPGQKPIQTKQGIYLYKIKPGA